MDFLKGVFDKVKSGFSTGVMSLKSLITFIDEQIIRPVVDGYQCIQSSIIDWIKTAVNDVKTYFVELKTNVQYKFDTAIESFTSTAGNIINTGALGFYTYFGQVVDKLIPLNISITAKINIWLAIAAFVLFIQYVYPWVSALSQPIVMKMFLILCFVLACIIVPSIIQTQAKTADAAAAAAAASYNIENFFNV
jgi:hypothetical protein